MAFEELSAVHEELHDGRVRRFSAVITEFLDMGMHPEDLYEGFEGREHLLSVVNPEVRQRLEEGE